MSDSHVISETSSTSSLLPTRVILDTDILPLIIQFFRFFGLLVSIWFLGYFNFSICWIVLGLFVWLWREKQRKEREFKTEIAHAAARDEKASILARVEDLPSWVYFPDTERAEWLNKIINQMWPYINIYAYDLVKNSIEPVIRKSLPSYLQAFRFEAIVLGDNSLRIGGIKVYRDHVHRDEIIMDIDIMYAGDGNIDISINRIKAGIKDIMLNGRMRVIMRPLIPQIPMMGAVTVFFLSNPTIDFNLTQLADVLDIPGLSDMLRKIVQDQLASMLVLPNKFVLPLAENIDISKLRFPEPDGVLRIYGIACRELRKADFGVLGMGKSDPYVVIHVGAQEFRTKTINNKIDPVWSHVYEALVDQVQGQSVEIEVYDEDPGSKDDFLGRVTIDIYSVAKKGYSDSWIPLEDTTRGSIRLKLCWLSLSKNPVDLSSQLMECENMKSEEHLSSALLMVYVDSAQHLPNAKRTAVEPSPYVQFTLGNKKYTTAVKPDTNDPVWEENFKIKVGNPELQDLIIETASDLDTLSLPVLSCQVLDKKSGKPLGFVNLPLQKLLSNDNLEMYEPLTLRESGPGSKLHLRMRLRILKAGAAMKKQGSISSETYRVTPPKTTETEVKTDTNPVKDDGASTSNQLTGNQANKENVEDGEIIPKTENLVTADNVSRSGSLRRRNFRSLSEATGPESHMPLSIGTFITMAACSEVEFSTAPAVYSPVGNVKLTILYNAQRGLLSIVVHKVKNLHSTGEHSPDPYITIYLLPERSANTKRKTQVVKNSLNPIFEETMEYNVNQTDLKKHTLEVTLKTVTSRFSRGKGIIGQVKIDLSEIELNKSFTEWYELESLSASSSRSSKESGSPKTANSAALSTPV